jgi:GntR family transcriptional regulator
VIEIVTGDPRPLFRQIVDGIHRKIATGELPAGSRLPSVRSLAMQLTLNPNTVAKAYAELVAEGAIESLKGVGLFVSAPRQRLSADERERRLDEAVQQLVSAVLPLGFEVGTVVERVARELTPLTPASHAAVERRGPHAD